MRYGNRLVSKDILCARAPSWSHEWLGAPCCANRAAGIQFTINDDPVYLPNQCCNPPDDGDYGVPGNHCECFSNRGYPIPNALPI